MRPFCALHKSCEENIASAALPLLSNSIPSPQNTPHKPHPVLLQELSLQCCPRLAASTWPAAMTSMTGLRTLHLCTLRLTELPEPVLGEASAG